VTSEANASFTLMAWQRLAYRPRRVHAPLLSGLCARQSAPPLKGHLGLALGSSAWEA
jgi:hypothetical protein